MPEKDKLRSLSNIALSEEEHKGIDEFRGILYKWQFVRKAVQEKLASMRASRMREGE